MKKWTSKKANDPQGGTAEGWPSLSGSWDSSRGSFRHPGATPMGFRGSAAISLVICLVLETFLRMT